MGSAATLFRLRWRTIANTLAAVGEHSKLKILFIASFGGGVLTGLFLIFYEMFSFLNRFAEVQEILIGYLFSMFFMSLMVMLIFSTCIIAFTSIFRSRETSFLLPCPFRPEDVFLYKLTDSMVFSSWAFLLLGTPLMAAYGLTNSVPWYFYPTTLLFYAVFVGVPASVGGLITLAIAVYFPRKRKQIVVLLSIVLVVVVALWVSDIVRQGKMGQGSLDLWVSGILSKISFCQNPFLPSWWISEGVLASARGKIGRSILFFLTILSTVLFFLMLSYFAAAARYRDGWSLCQSSGQKARRRREWIVYRAIERLLFLQPPPVRLLIMKDIKTFFRDPGQWSQVLLFVGLLLLYILNLRNLGYHLQGELWKSIISFLNLSATALVLSTFTGRFVFPMLSLEGRKFWILGLLPIRRRAILVGKFLFAVGGSLLISATLIILSDWMLEVEMSIFALHLITIVILCVGLSAISVGFGAAFPNLREDNPSKIVAGFGGTLNLMVSLAFIAVVVALMAAPSHLYLARKVISIEIFRAWIGRSIAMACIIGAIACVVPLVIGLRRFERLEF